MKEQLPLSPYLLFFKDKETEEDFNKNKKNRLIWYNLFYLVGRILSTIVILIGYFTGEQSFARFYIAIISICIQFFVCFLMWKYPF